MNQSIWAGRVTAVSFVVLFGCTGEITSPAGDPPGDQGGAGPTLASDPLDDGLPIPPDDRPRVTADYAVDDSLFPNPERGFTIIVDPTDLGDLQRAATKGLTMVNAIAHVDAYRDQDLPPEYLDQLAAGFEQARALGLKMALRFRYDDGDGLDASEPQLLRHIDQIAPLLREHVGVVAVFQAGFIGAWGEWHHSANGLDTPEARGAVLYALLDALPASRSVQVRTPTFKDEQFPGGALTEDEAWTEADVARVGHHNDCFLASDTDYGTYHSPVDEWRAYVAADTRYTPMGGETCAVYEPRTNCDAAVAEMELMHWSYLNQGYHPDVLAGWVSGGCYDEVARRLGYRLELVSASWPETLTAGRAATIEITLRNTGFAAPFNERPVYLVLEGPGGRFELPVRDSDPRHWSPGATHVVTADVAIPDVAPGGYRLSLWLPDADPALAGDPAFAIHLASQATWDPATGLNLLTAALAIE